MTAMIDIADAVFPSAAVCAALAITYRELDYGVVSDVFPCTQPAQGSGSVRMFSALDLIAIESVMTKRRLAIELWPTLANFGKGAKV